MLKTRGEETEQGVHCWRLPTHRAMHRAADPPRVAHMTASDRSGVRNLLGGTAWQRASEPGVEGEDILDP